MDISALEPYNDIIDQIEAEAESKLQEIRLRYHEKLISLENRNKNWQVVYNNILHHFEPVQLPELKILKNFEDNKPTQTIDKRITFSEKNTEVVETDACNQTPLKNQEQENELKSNVFLETKKKEEEKQADAEPPDLVPSDANFGNLKAIEGFLQSQKVLADVKNQISEFINNESMRNYRNQLYIFIRTQINSISNKDSLLLDSKTKNLTNLFDGNQIVFQQKVLDSNQDPAAKPFCIDLTAQTFVTVGSKLSSSSDLATSMATVICGLIDKFPLFKDLLFVHLKIRCPYLTPMYIERKDMTDDICYKIACGYSYDAKNKTFETEEKYSSKMRSLVIMTVSALIQSKRPEELWFWLASFLNLKPQPVITAMILQAFLQQSFDELQRTYRRQFTKIMNFIKTEFLTMIEKVTPEDNVQSLIKLKNFLSETSNLKF